MESKKNYETIWTVLSIDDEERYNSDHCVAGSYMSFDKALAEAVDYVIERIQHNGSLAFAFANDENHEEMQDSLTWILDHVNGDRVVFHKPVEEIREFIRGEFEAFLCYHIYDGVNAYKFDLEENGLVMDSHDNRTGYDDGDVSIVDGKPEDATAIHNAIMAGLDAKGIRYESDGESYWVDCQDGDTRYIGVDVCAD